MKKIFVVLTIVISFITLCACNYIANKNSAGTNSSTDESAEIYVPDSSNMFTNADKDATYDENASKSIVLSGDTAFTSSSEIAVSNGYITITSEGVYTVTGSGTNQTVVVDAADAKIRLVLSDVSIINSNFATLYIKNADKVFIILKGDNKLSVSGEFVAIDENSVDGAIFAKDNITIQGDGSLTVASSKHGIVGKDDIKITGGTIDIDAASHGIQANDSVRIADAALSIVSGKDGVHVENTDDTSKGYFYFESGRADIMSAYDGIDTSSTVHITGGNISICAGGGSNKTVSSSISTKGIKAQMDILIAEGTITVDSSDDCVHSNSSIEISGGELSLSSGDDGVHADNSLLVSGGTVIVSKSYEGLEAQNVNISGGKISVKASDDGINAAGGNDSSSIGGRPGQNSFNTNAGSFILISGGEIYVDASGDGIDSNGNLTVSGGTTIVEGPSDSGNGALDYDGSATITGGTFVAIGASGMAMNFSSATQGSILLNFSSQRAGTTISLSDAYGNEIISVVASKTYSSVLISSPDLKQGSSFSITAGTASTSLTLSTLIYGSGSGMGGGQPGGGFGGPGGRW